MELEGERLREGMVVYDRNSNQGFVRHEERWLDIWPVKIRWIVDWRQMTGVWMVSWQPLLPGGREMGGGVMGHGLFKESFSLFPNYRYQVFHGLELLLEHEREVMEYLIGDEKPK